MDSESFFKQMVEGLGGKVEPDAQARQMATALFSYYQAAIDAGFDKEQAMQIIGAILMASKRQ